MERQRRRVRGVSGEWVEIETELDVEKCRPLLQQLLDAGIKSLAIAFLHSFTFPAHEQALAELALSMGFSHVSSSAALIPMARIVPRGHTACVDAYLTPGIKTYVHQFLSGFDEGLANVKVLFMQSDGGLTPAQHFSGFRAILSGPSGGVVGYAETTFEKESSLSVIGFDMGGTSTDVSRFDGSYAQTFETTTAGVVVQAPQLDISTVAAGGGSILKFEAGVFRVGPDSVSAHPGPVCYRKGGQLAVTDANLVLGRILPDFFPKIFGPGENEPLDAAGSRAAFQTLAVEINSHMAREGGRGMSDEEVAMGFLNVANESMCRPIRELTEMKGYDAGSHVLACFGGAGPQHACAIARALKIKSVIVHRFCGILSAYGMGLADVVAEAQEPTAEVFGVESLKKMMERMSVLEGRVKEQLHRQGFQPQEMRSRTTLNMRYAGTDTAIMVKAPETEMTFEGDDSNASAPPESFNFGPSFDFKDEFLRQFRREYGFELTGREVLVDDVRVTGVGRTNLLQLEELPREEGAAEAEEVQHSVFFDGAGWVATPVFLLEKLRYGHVLPGPAVIMNGNSTVIVEPGCSAAITRFGNIRINIGERVTAQAPSAASDSKAGDQTEEASAESQAKVHSSLPAPRKIGKELDVVQLSIFGNRFMGIAEQMGRTLQRTSISTNIKERLDFSCAIFSPEGGLVANAPHVPVHLGAMSSTVTWQVAHWATAGGFQEGDVLMTNHPAAGGSHLPDITVITPVFEGGKIIFFVASRGHHAEIGGITPGSMPPFSKSISEEGAAVKALKIVEGGDFQEAAVRDVLLATKVGEEGQAIPGSRRIEDNISDLRAQVAANQRGIALIKDLVGQHGLDVVQAYMGHVQSNAEFAVRRMLKAVAARVAAEIPGCIDGSKVSLGAEDAMDDGSLIRLSLTLDRDEGTAVFDFDGTSPEVYGNWNAPEAVTAAAVIYCLRCLVDVEIPLNQGCLAPVRIRIPKGSFLSPSDSAAVVGGNVLTSQRVTDVILSAFQACACSQGCMNNLTFGNDTFGYYETIAGGAGAGPDWDGASAVQCHMTNTRMTDPEIFERRYPVLLRRFGVRDGSGGEGAQMGGDGVVREIEFREQVTVSILSERRVLAPRGMRGGGDGKKGANYLIKEDERKVYLGGKNSVKVKAGERLLIETPGGGGFGRQAS